MFNLEYDYRELAYDLYEDSANLLAELVELRLHRKLSQAALATQMGVETEIIEGIENGSLELTQSLVIGYALEVGARISTKIEKAEEKPEDARYYQKTLTSDTNRSVSVSYDFQNKVNTNHSSDTDIESVTRAAKEVESCTVSYAL